MTMNKQETVTIVERIWSTWNLDFPAATRKAAYGDWYRLMIDLDFEECAAALDEIIIEDKPFPPRPGTLRRRVINARGGDGDPPSAADAWACYRRNVVAAANGEPIQPLHPLVVKAIQGLSQGTGYQLNTNGDRQFFFNLYGEIVAGYEAEKYRVQR